MNPDLNEQIAYYSARAAEYDEWWFRQGRYDWGIEKNLQWANESDGIRRRLKGREMVETGLELACGTGIWTHELLKFCDHVTALDASAEMIAINSTKLQSPKVEYQRVDLFQWSPARQYDFVFAGFFLSHVPPDRLPGFLKTIADALKPDGRFFFVDSQNERSSMAKDHGQPVAEVGTRRRKLKDGREFTVVKVFYDPVGLESEFQQAGIQLKVERTENYFLYGEGRRC